MRVLVVEENLLWSSRLRTSIVALGFEVEVLKLNCAKLPAADVAILNLSDPIEQLELLAPRLRAQGTKIVGHAGHKEGSLLSQGDHLKLDRVVTNSELTYKIREILIGLVETPGISAGTAEIGPDALT